MEGPGIIDDLGARGLLQDATDEDRLRERLAAGPTTLYCGFDPTADSLHVGNLLPLLVLKRFQLAGHKPLALAGGATGMIGDPSGKSQERQLLGPDELDANLEAIRLQLERFLDFAPGPTQAGIVDNRLWTEPTTLLDFLRDVGKQVTVNTMLAKESVKARVQSEVGISFTEFSYMLLQANDFWWLHEHEGCELQIGGSDQWGNITAGIDLIRRRSGGAAHGLTVPLLTRADGHKFGKSDGENIWLNAERTSPYRFYQFFMQADDRDVERFLLQLTLLEPTEVAAVMAEHAEAPGRRDAQRRLAGEVTALVHGPEESAAAREASEVLFGGTDRPSVPALEAIAGEVPTTIDRRSEGMLVDLLVDTGLAKSKSDARRGIDAGEIRLNSDRVTEDRELTAGDLLGGRFLLLRRGKKRYHLVVGPS